MSWICACWLASVSRHGTLWTPQHKLNNQIIIVIKQFFKTTLYLFTYAFYYHWDAYIINATYR